MKTIESNFLDNIFVGIEVKKKAVVFPAFSTHNVHEIFILRSGKRKVFLGNLLYATEAGDAVMISANKPHRSFGDTPYSGICIEFSDECLKRNFNIEEQKLIVSIFEKPVISLSEEALRIIWQKGKDAANGSISKRGYIIEIAKILKTYARFTDSNAKLTFQTDLSPIGSYIQKHYIEINGLDDLAKHFKVTKSYLCRIFKQQTGITIIHYINSLRIQYACRFLVETDIPIRDISKMCGYETVIYFNRIFKRIMEDTPGNIRRLARESQMYVLK